MFENDHPDAFVKIIDFGLSKRYNSPNQIITERLGTLYYMSPEQLEGTYTSQADLWSVGVCVYMLLANGQKPFDAKTPKELMEKIMSGQPKGPPDESLSFSDLAQTYLDALLCKEATKRLTANQALQHEWITTHTSQQVLKTTPSTMQKVRDQLIRYADNTGGFKKLALNLIAKKSTPDEIMELRTVFNSMDIHNSGSITLDDFKAALDKQGYTDHELERIFCSLDINHDHTINYTEFLAATLETKGKIDDYRIAEAFEQLDCDNKGFITREDICNILGTSGTEIYVDKLMLEVDSEGKDKITYPEFKRAITKQSRLTIGRLYDETCNKK